VKAQKKTADFVVLESRLGLDSLESGLKSIFAGLGLGLGLESYGLGLEGSASKSFFKSFVSTKYRSIRKFLAYLVKCVSAYRRV